MDPRNNVSLSRPRIASNQLTYLSEASERSEPWGGNYFHRAATDKLQEITGSSDVFLTQSCTGALELAAIGLNIKPGDEVIVPSYTFVSSASAFTMRGATPVFVDIDPITLKLNPELVEKAITPRTKAIVAVHYGGDSCEMAELVAIAQSAKVFLVEDAAQSIGARINGSHLGTIGHLGCISFHGTKNLSSGEGGALLVSPSAPEEVVDRITIAYEKGTDRTKFIQGQIDKYTWRGEGSSFIPSEFTSAVLLAQLEELDAITRTRLEYWQSYFLLLNSGSISGVERILDFTSGVFNGHMFGIILNSSVSRAEVVSKMKSKGITVASHYQPLHVSPYISQIFPSAQKNLPFTEDLSNRLLRFPLWSDHGLPIEDIVGKFTSVMDSI
jgi:dTDP-4-amino-4,6-dideoxygalactose transaminase